MKVRYAVVGAGWISQDAFMPSIPQTNNSEITAIVSGNAEVMEQLGEFYGIEKLVHYDDYDALLNSGEIDAVYIALPNSLHADFAIRALKAGVHALVEKPLAISREQCEAMVAASNESGAYLMTEYRMHHEPKTLEVIEGLRDGSLVGEPRLIQCSFGFTSPESNHRLKGEHWGGPLQDVGIYCINACRYLFDAEPIEVSAMQTGPENDPRFAEVGATFAVNMKFPGGRLAQFTCSFDVGMHEYCNVVGSKAAINMTPAFHWAEPMRITRREEQEWSQQIGPKVDQFGGIAEYFSDCIQQGVAPESDGVEGLIDVSILEAIERSLVDGKPQLLQLPEKPKRMEIGQAKYVPHTDRKLVL